MLTTWKPYVATSPATPAQRIMRAARRRGQKAHRLSHMGARRGCWRCGLAMLGRV